MTTKEKLFSISLYVFCLFFVEKLNAQEDIEILPENAEFKDLTTKYWVNTYGNIRLSEKFFWVAQTHFRFEETEATPFVGQIGQLYNRHALGYIFSKKINFSLGGVLRVNFNTDDLEIDGDICFV